jgi:hypothetical protein
MRCEISLVLSPGLSSGELGKLLTVFIGATIEIERAEEKAKFKDPMMEYADRMRAQGTYYIVTLA